MPIEMPDFANYGLAQALSYKHDWNTDIARLQANGERIRQVKANTEAKMAYYREKFKMPPMDNDYDRKQMEGLVQAKIQEVRDFEQKNPNWRYLLEGQLGFENIVNGIVNNEFTLRNNRVKGSYDQFRKDAMEGKLKASDIEMYEQQYENYSKFGNINGPNDLGDVQEFKYEVPQNIDLPKLFKTYADQGRKAGIIDKGAYTYIEKSLNKGDAQMQATVMLAEYYEDLEKEFTKQPPAIKDDKYHGSLFDWVTDNIMSVAEKDISGLQYKPRPKVINTGSGKDEVQSIWNSPYGYDVMRPYETGQKTGNTSAVSMFVKGSGNKILVDDVFYVNINGKKIAVNGNGRRMLFGSKPGMSTTYTDTKKGISTKVESEGLEGYDGNGKYPWQALPKGDGEDLYLFYDVNMSSDDIKSIAADLKNSGQITKEEYEQWYMDAYNKANNNFSINIGTGMDYTNSSSSAIKYNQTAGQKLKPVYLQETIPSGNEFEEIVIPGYMGNR